MKIRASVFVLMLFVAGSFVASSAQNNVDLKFGNILAAVGNGTYQVVDSTGSPLGSIQNGAGDTRGCTVDSSYHPITTDLSDGLINRWNINVIPAFNTPNQVISTIKAAGQSLALDSLGNLYVGQPGGNGCVLEYDVNGKFVSNLPLKCSNNSTLKGGTPWIDLDPTASTVYFGNAGKTVSQFGVACTKSPAKNCVSSFGPSFSAVYGVRILTPDAVTGSGGSGYMLVAAGSQVALLSSSGSLIRSYTASGESDFEVLTLLSGGTQFAAGSPSTHNVYIFNYSSSSPASSFALAAGPAGMCTYGLADAAQPQPQLANVRSCSPSSGTAAVAPPGGTGCNNYTSNTAAFDLPGDITDSKLLVTFPDLSGSGTLTAHVTTVKAGSVSSDPAPFVISSNTGVPEGGPFTCSPDPNNLCYVWEVEPSGITLGTDFTYDDVSVSQNGPGDPSIHLFKNDTVDITYYTGANLDGGGAGRTTLSVYSLNNFVPSGGPNGSGDVVCPTGNDGYLSPVVPGQVYNFGSVVPFKFQVAASLADCKKNKFLTNLGNTAYLTLEQCADTSCTDFGNSNAPVTAVVTVSGNSGAPPIYNEQSNAYHLNADSSSLTPGACYFATTSAPGVTSFNTTFCLTSK